MRDGGNVQQPSNVDRAATPEEVDLAMLLEATEAELHPIDLANAKWIPLFAEEEQRDTRDN